MSVNVKIVGLHVSPGGKKRVGEVKRKKRNSIPTSHLMVTWGPCEQGKRKTVQSFQKQVGLGVDCLPRKRADREGGE